MINQEIVHLFISKIALFLAYILAIGPISFFKAFTSLAMGDDTAKEEGLLTINPLAHIDFFGLGALTTVGIGWYKNVPINPANINDPRRKIKLFIAYFADVFLHILFASMALLLLGFLPFYLQKASLTHWLPTIWYSTTMTIIEAFVVLNTYLAAFGALYNGATYFLVLLDEDEDFEYKEYIFYASIIVPILIVVLFRTQMVHVFAFLVSRISGMFVWLLS